MFYLKKIILIFIMFILIIPISFSAGMKVQNYEFRGTLNSDYLEVDFLVDMSLVDISPVIFSLRATYEGTDLGEICVRDITSKIQLFSCALNNRGEGTYLFEINLLDENESVVDSKIIVENLILGGSQNIISENGQTIVTINVLEGENLLVEHTIDKSVIPSINDENRDKVISSDKEFIIIEEDPVIAWHVEKAPEEIRYTIDEEVSPDKLDSFSTEIQENSPFPFLRIVVFILIILIVFIAFKQGFKKR